MTARDNQKTFLDTPLETLISFLKEHAQGAFRARQIYDWFYNRQAGSFDECPTSRRAFARR